MGNTAGEEGEGLLGWDGAGDRNGTVEWKRKGRKEHGRAKSGDIWRQAGDGKVGTSLGVG